MNREDEKAISTSDRLAVERTHMANERTLLAYVRTALAFTGMSVLIWRFDASEYSGEYGIAVFFFALIILMLGIIRYRQFRNRINRQQAGR